MKGVFVSVCIDLPQKTKMSGTVSVSKSEKEEEKKRIIKGEREKISKLINEFI